MENLEGFFNRYVRNKVERIKLADQKKILILVTNTEIGGAQNHIYLLSQGLQGRYRFSIYTGQDGAHLVGLTGNEVSIIPALTRKSFFPALFAIYRLIKSEKPDLIHTHSAVASFVGRIAGRLAGVKTLYTIHGWHFVPNSVWKRRVFGWLLELIVRPFTSAWIAVSEYDLELGVRKGVINQKRAWVVPNGVEDIPVVRTKPLNENGLDLVFVGRASYQKNCLEAIEILKHSPKMVTLTMYVTSGDHLHSLIQAIEDSDLSDRVTVITDNPDASNQLQNYDAMLLTSRYEGMPLCVLEAMRASLPVVATDVCGMSEIVEDNKTGFLYSLNDINQAAGYISKLGDLQMRQQFGKEARRRFLENHTAEKMAARTAEIYEKLLEN